jgi:putative ABC transport system permease protein
MIKHYFKIAFRSLAKQKALTFINISGLSIGLACFILFLLYAVNEFSFDRFHAKADNIYRVYRWSEAMGGEDASGDVYMPAPLGPAMKQDIPDVVDFVRIQDGWANNFVKVDDKILRGIVSFADPSFFTMFSFEFVYGNPGMALRKLDDIVITESKAKELFGSANALGRSIQVKIGESFIPFTVSGVTKDVPSNSSLTYEMMGSWQFQETTSHGKRSINQWKRSSYLTYVQLKEGSGLMNDKKRMAAFRHKYYPNEIEDIKRSGYTWTGEGSPVSFGLHPLRESHTHTTISGGSIGNVNPKTIWILVAIAGAVLLIACINFTTLAIGRSASRAREVGLRKVIGGERKQLIYQFLSEAILLSIFSALIGLALTRLLLPWFNELSGRQLSLSFSQFPEVGWMLAVLIVLVGVLAGSYPALILSGFKPIEVLKSKIKVGGANLFTRSLVTLQFAISIGLIISTFIILEQTKYMSTRNPGFNKENIVMVNAEEVKGKEVFALFKQSLAARPEILGVAASEVGLGDGAGWSRAGFEYKGTHKDVFEYYIDDNYINVMGMKVIAGRNFNPAIAADSVTSIIVNEAMVRDFGWTIENAVGQQLTGFMESKTPVVIGVVKDFHFRPLREEIKPQMFHQFADYAPRQFFVRIASGNPAPALAAMQKAWDAAEAVIPFQYTFLDESLDNFYKAEQRWSRIAGWAGGISIFLACLGLFGLASLAAINRTKEIGIRKVLGASLPSLVQLLSKDFLKLVIVAMLIAAPIAWYLMRAWLNDFAYRISISGWLIVSAGVLALLIAFITVAFQAIKAGVASPVKSLRSE